MIVIVLKKQSNINGQNKFIIALIVIRLDNVPFESYWINGRDLGIIVIDGVLPCFKKGKMFCGKRYTFFFFYKMLT